MKQSITLLGIFFSVSIWAQTPGEIENNKLMQRDLEIRQNEEIEFKKKNPNWANHEISYLELQIKLENDK